MKHAALTLEKPEDLQKVNAPLTLIFEPDASGLDRIATGIFIQLKTVPKPKRKVFLQRVGELLDDHKPVKGGRRSGAVSPPAKSRSLNPTS